MIGVVQYSLGILILILAFPIGVLLARFTKEELKSGQKYFKVLIGVCVFGLIVSLIIQKIELVFMSLFTGIVAGMSVWMEKGEKNIKRP
jgi:RsiW-degrading membrane proteinase PrsW (M82 family)